ncbi:hypothetical protein Pla175_17830 [Pirellulimonas nuda]|uniref:Uncharacterized protein n=1 Tax=Pirellulimonas nuda TaxID=2528009 RepID=A0A518DA88_9BACT|nr:hypothetical protein [Pirellulimonas nuda]QDU88407.1 hypothetical protein Pla175_17830 [Pirellulimonas nuda]
MNPTTDPEFAAFQEALVVRDPFVLRDLPTSAQWEFTRRHPYYQTAWRLAPDVLQATVTGNLVDPLPASMILGMMSAIGVVTDINGLPSPETAFDDLDGPGAEWAHPSSVHPLMIRDLLCLLIATLPREDAVYAAMYLREAVLGDPVEGDDEHRTQQRFNQIQMARLRTSDGFKSLVDEPFFAIHLRASQRQIQKDLGKHIKRLREQKSIPERRVHVKKMNSLLATFDAIEGWEEGRYHLEKAMTIQDVAARAKESRSTVWNRYLEAFRLLTGHPYTFELWWKLLANLKIAQAEVDRTPENYGSLTRRRDLASRQVPVNESRLGGDNEMLRDLDSTESNAEFTELRMDLESLWEKGASDDEIAETLGYPVAFVQQCRSFFATSGDLDAV